MFSRLIVLASILILEPAVRAQPLHHTKALQLVDEISGAQAVGVFTDAAGLPLNRYGGSWGSAVDPSFIRFADFAAGVLPANNTKCSPLITHLLKYCYGWNWKNYPFVDPLTLTTKTVSSPTPYQYIALLKQGRGFAMRITALNQALPGDLLFWWRVGTDQNDHAMILSSVNWASAKDYPDKLAGADPSLANTIYYEVEIIDSTENVHTNDSRVVPMGGSSTFLAGVGTATIGVLVDRTTCAIVGATWSLPTSNFTTQPNGWLQGLHSRLKRVPVWEIAIGRLP